MGQRDQLPRWATAWGVWVLVLLVGIIGWGIKEYKISLESTLARLQANQEQLTSVVHNHDTEIRILKSERDRSPTQYNH